MEGLDQMKWAPDMQQLVNPNALIAKLERRYESDVVRFCGVLFFVASCSLRRSRGQSGAPTPRAGGVAVACDSFASTA